MTNSEIYLAYLAGEYEGELPQPRPIRSELYLAAMCGVIPNTDLPAPLPTRKQMYLHGLAVNGGGSGGGGGGGSSEEWIGDGNTHIWIHLEEGRTSPMLGCCPNGTVTVDWGDGSTPDVLTGTDTSTVKWTPTHSYAAAGDYVITLTVDGTMGVYGSSYINQYSGVLRYSDKSHSNNAIYANAVQKVEAGSCVTTIGDYAFRGCYHLMCVSLSDGVTNIGLAAFQYCRSLRSVVLPNGLTTIGEAAFQYCYDLEDVTIPDSVINIPKTAFQDCRSLRSVVLPNGLTTIGDKAFQYCYDLEDVAIPDSVINIQGASFQTCFSMVKLRFESATPPAVASSVAFQYFPTDCIISVPVGSLDAYKAATNYPDPYTYTYIEED